MRAMLQRLQDVLYPPECVGCRVLTDLPHGLCPACWADTHFITGPICCSCGMPVPTAAPGEDPMCEPCSKRPPAWDTARAAVLYEGRARDTLLRFKHQDRLDLSPVLARWMARPGAELLKRTTLIAPVPLHWTRRIKRRSNQSAELARQPALSAHAPVVADLLCRTRATRSLKGLKPGERHKELSGAISVSPHHAAALDGAHLLLIDDVMTTGATLSACAEAARAAGAKEVNALVVARVAREDFAVI